MECGILQRQQKIIKSITVLRFCKSEHLATQHNFSGHHQSSHNPPLYSASYWPVAVKIQQEEVKMTTIDERCQ
jgi:hypothetical protein